MKFFNKKTILFFSMISLMFTGCVAKNEFESKSLEKKTSWGKIRPDSMKDKTIKKDDCIDCYATAIDYSKPPSASNNVFNKVVDTKNYSNVIKKKYVLPSVTHINRSYGSYSTSSTTAIQVGAFSKYNGAKIYKKKYDALSNKYKVTIKTGSKNNKPLYRVRIEGFKNKAEAKKFMYSYGIRDAFVVRK